MVSNVKALVMFPSVKLVLTRADFATPGPVAILFPVLIATRQPSDSPSPSAAALIPLASVLPHRERFILHRLPERPLPHNRPGLVTGSPLLRSPTVEVRGLPGYWAVLFERAPVKHPAGGSTASPSLSTP